MRGASFRYDEVSEVKMRHGELSHEMRGVKRREEETREGG